MNDHTILILVALLLMIAFFSSNYPYTGSAIDTGAAITSVTCTWNDDHFDVCMTVLWTPPDDTWYVTPFITGGTYSLSTAPTYNEEAFTHCDDVGATAGRKAANAYVYTQGRLKQKLISSQTTCATNQPRFTDHASFTAYQNTKRADGTGAYTLSVPPRATSCTLAGHYRFRNPVQEQLKGSGKLYCDGATGTFTSTIDRYTQHTTDDRDPFSWGGLSRGQVNPQPETTTGYLFHTKACDSLAKDRYYVRARGTLDNDQLIIDWEYYNDDTKPMIDYIFDITCAAKDTTPLAPPITTTPLVEFPAELAQEPPVTPEPFATDFIEPPPTFFARLKQRLAALLEKII